MLCVGPTLPAEVVSKHCTAVVPASNGEMSHTSGDLWREPNWLAFNSEQTIVKTTPHVCKHKAGAVHKAPMRDRFHISVSVPNQVEGLSAAAIADWR